MTKTHAIRYEIVGGIIGKLKNDPETVLKAISKIEKLISNANEPQVLGQLFSAEGLDCTFCG